MKANLTRLGSFILLLLGGYSAYWYYIAYFADQWVDQVAAGLADSGFELDYQRIETGGFPYRLEVDLSDVAFVWRDGPMEVSFEADNLTIITPPWNRRHLIFQAQSPRIDIRSSEAGWINWKLFPRTFSASYGPRNEGGYRFSSVADNVDTGEAGQRGKRRGYANSISLHVQMLDTPEGLSGTNGLLEPELARLAFAINDWSPQGGDEIIELMEIETRIHSRFWPRLQLTALENWAREGSSLEVNRIAVHLPGATAIGEGSFALDERLRPLGTLSFALSDAGRTGAALKGVWSAPWLDNLVQALDAARPTSADDTTAILGLMLVEGDLRANDILINSFGTVVRR